jgi:NAD(P)-dependent dehydrogenase (short-subunit alcohol dehydrogenase family)
MCEYPHVVVTGASSSAGRAVTLCLAASGYHVYAGVRTHASGVALHQHTPPFAGPLAAMSATLRGELAPWHIDVTLTESGTAAGAVTRALTAPRPRATSPSPWFGLYDLDAASPSPL